MKVEKIRLGKRQKEVAEWAIDGMASMCPEDYKDLGYEEDEVPTIEGDHLVLRHTENILNVLDDLIYRLDEQLEDMTHDAAGIPFTSYGWDELTEEEKNAILDMQAGKRLAQKLKDHRSKLGGTNQSDR